MFNLDTLMTEYQKLVKEKASRQRIMKLLRKNIHKITQEDVDPQGKFKDHYRKTGKEATLYYLSKHPFKVQRYSDGGTEWVWFKRDYLEDFLETPIHRSIIKSALSDRKYQFLFQEYLKLLRQIPAVKTLLNDPALSAQVTTVLRETGQVLFVAVQKAVLTEIPSSITPEDKIEALSKSANYHDVDWRQLYQRLVFLREQTENVRQQILDRIPENPIDLYPAARRLHRHFILHVGPTNSGKTHDSMTAFRKAERGVYLAPLRLMANEIYDQTNHLGVPCSMETGEEHIPVAGAQHAACTIELMDPAIYYDVAVIDEAQMLEDPARGGNWTAAILGVLASEIHICMAPYAENLVKQLIGLTGDTYEVVYHHRQTPLRIDHFDFTFPEKVRRGDALIVFSKKSVLYVAAELRSRHISCSVIYGALPYDVRANEVAKFAKGETDVVVATDAIGMGLNLPIRRIVFLEMTKFDGFVRRDLKPSEIQQIAGRAGRYGKFEVGYYTAEFAKDRLRSEYRSTVQDLTTCYLRFPKTLLSIDSPVSVLLQQWAEMENTGIFVKSDMKEEIRLAEELEELSDDKDLIYDFCMIPYDAEDMKLHDVWLELFAIAESGDDTYDILRYLSYRKYKTMDLNDLEEEHKLIGLLLFYSWKYSISEYSDELLQLKKEVCDYMIDELSKQNFMERTCPRCKKHLPWNWPYRVCDDCYKRLGRDSNP